MIIAKVLLICFTIHRNAAITRLWEVSPIFKSEGQFTNEEANGNLMINPNANIPSSAQLLMDKNETLQSYHPHYLHSFSYPEPISPHFYFGQVNYRNQPVFYIQNNDTLNGREMADEIFYVNGARENSINDLLNANFKKIREQDLKFMMVLQVENSINMTMDIETKIIVYNFDEYLGIICDLGNNRSRAFILHLSENGRKAMNLSSLPQNVNMYFRNQSMFNNTNSWKNAKHIAWVGRSFANIFGVQEKPNIFSTFVVELRYSTVKAAKTYKLCMTEFSKIASNETVQEIYERMKNSVKINSQRYYFNITKAANNLTCESEAVRQLMSGLSYEYGTLILKNGTTRLKNEPKQLLSFTPSRKRFPWGFLWDDGFHCEVAMRKNPEMALKVLKSWLNTITETGWIPREQNRGAERQELCDCPRFMEKDIRDGNPPTLIFSLHYLAKSKKLTLENFGIAYYNKLQKWYQWFLDTQQTEPNSFIFRWHDSIMGSGSFNSGMDDFPRMKNTFGHVDCQAWMFLFSSAMADISYSLQVDGYTYVNNSFAIKQKLMENFIEPNTNLCKDYSFIRGKKQYTPNFGYPSILPIAFGIIDENSIIFKSMMSKIKKQLDSGFGLTSISMLSREYLARDAYWRGPVWININYLFLKGLKTHYSSEKTYYEKLRSNIIETVCGNLKTKGSFFQNYIAGVGSFSYPFTGWTSLISIIINQDY